MTRSTEATREKILGCAEELFASEGIDRVTLRQIGRAASQRNVAAVQYHFGGKDELLTEILDRHLKEIDDRRGELLDAQRDRREVEVFLDALVSPLIEKLDDPSGRAYLRIQAQRPTPGDQMRPATRRMTRGLTRVLARSQRDPMQDRFVVLLLFGALADRARQEESGEASPRTRRRFADSLSRAILGIYQEGSADQRGASASA